MCRFVGAALAVLMLMAGEAQAARLIAVLPLDVSNTQGKLNKAAQASLEEMLRDVATNALRPLGWTILSGENTIQVLIDNGVKPEECGSQSCHLANARELKAEAFISGTVQHVDGAFIASFRLIDTKTGSILTSERVKGKSVSEVSEGFEAKATGFFEKAGLLQGGPASSSTTKDTSVVPPAVDSTRPQVKKSKVTEAVGSLTVTAKPKDAVRIEFVDPSGKKQASGVPYKNEAATPGTWKVIAKASGYEEEQQTIEVPPDDVTVVKFDLKLLGALSVEGEPVGAAVEVSGPGGFKDDGGLPWEASGLRSGTYQVKVTRKGYADANETIEVMPGKTAAVKVALSKGEGGNGKTKVEPKSGLEFVSLPGGTFQYGCAPGDGECSDDEKPGRWVTVEPFWLGKTEVTVEAYARCVNAGVCSKPATAKFCTWGVGGREKNPVNCVDWNQATQFCGWIGGRLPTAEEWEYAAKGGKGRKFPWGSEAATGQRANFCDTNCEYDWKDAGQNDGYATTAPVGAFPKGNTESGLQDMAGNVWEWMAGNYDASRKVARGGAWNTYARVLRASSRVSYASDVRAVGLGLRCGL
jgi:formylglycine-generating enzyme required for sulfatase activity